MKLYIVISIFKGLFEDVQAFIVDKIALDYAHSIRINYDPDEMEVIEREVEI